MNIYLIINKWRKLVARPKTIELTDGTVTLSGFPKEVGDALAEHIKNFQQPMVVVIPGSDVTKLTPQQVLTPNNNLDLPERAIGVYRNGRDVKLVTVSYDIGSNQAQVLNVKQMLDIKDASVAFKIASDKYKFIS